MTRQILGQIQPNRRLRRWMTLSLIPFSWIAGYAVAWAWTLPTTGVVDGVCYTLMLWKSHTDRLAFVAWYLLTFFVGLNLTFIFCYGRILIVIRRQAKVMASHGGIAGSTIAQAQSNKTKAKIVKTMILVSVLYVVLWSPGYCHNFLMNTTTIAKVGDVAFYIVIVMGYLYNCVIDWVFKFLYHPLDGKHVISVSLWFSRLDWRRAPGRPRNKWIDHLRNDSTRPIGELWRRAVERGHGGATTRRPSLATRP